MATLAQIRAKFPNKPESFYARQNVDDVRTPANVEATKPAKRIRQSSKPVMNGLEASFLPILQAQHPGYRIVPQAMRVQIARGAWYRVDFFIPAKLIAVEVKGPKVMANQQSRQLLALKMAAHQWPEITWWLVWKGLDGIWQKQQVLS